ncbi:copper chaperone PCu(A)C [Streptomyces spectabilis]|uniref:copper chaperone PCu(A)C n=1 Tax=Streptomyces spectabilis TaxID=68270 RepID=UPI0033D18CDB
MNHRTTRRRLLTGCAIALTAGLALTGCNDDKNDNGDKGTKSSEASADAATKPELKVSGAYVPVPAMDDMAGGFFTLTNKGAADKLVSASSPLAGSVTLHATKGSTMKEQKSFAVPANGRLVFARGGNHIMLEKLKHKPKQGDKVEVTLRFEKSAPITVEMPVKEATYNPKPHSGDPKKHAGDPKKHAEHDQHAMADGSKADSSTADSSTADGSKADQHASHSLHASHSSH